MLSALTAVRARGLAVLGRVSMYRLTLIALAVLLVVALGLSRLRDIGAGTVEIVAASAVLVVVCTGIDLVLQPLLRLPRRVESSLITAAILVFVVQPTLNATGLAGIALAGAAASVSKYVLVWRGRHVFNPAAVGAAVLLAASTFSGIPALGEPSWWVGSPMLGPFVLVIGVVVLWRTEKLRMIGLFWIVAVASGTLRALVPYAAGQVPVSPDLWAITGAALWSSPVLFLGAFVLSEPLTLPPRRHQQLIVAVVVGVLAGWAPVIGYLPIGLGAQQAVLVGNLVSFGFAFAARAAVRLVFEQREQLTPTVRVLTFRARRPLAFLPGQFLELDVPHRRPDARGTRREFSIASAPEDLPQVRIAFREAAPGTPGAKPQSSFKKALAAAAPGDVLAVTGVWGDFVLPKAADARILMVAAGIGVTPFVSQLRHLTASAAARDIVLVYVATTADELAFRDDVEAAGVPVVVFTRDEPERMPAGWRWAQGARLDAAGLTAVVPDLDRRHAYVSGPAALIAELAPALARARSITTDAFSGY